MPELPEVETIKNTVKQAMLGAVFKNVIVRERKFRQLICAEFESLVCGAKVIGLRRIAKYMLIDLDNGQSIIWHFGMSGKFKIAESIPEKLEKHDHIVLEADKATFIYNDTRRFGLVDICDSKLISKHKLFCHLGLDPWDLELTAEYLLKKFERKKTAIKIALLDQEIICGIGNIYASEILYKTRIHPQRSAESISLEEAEKIIAATREILEKAIAAGGSTIHDYKRPDGDIGYFQNSHCVYNKTGQRCPNCVCDFNKTGGIKKIVQGGRSTFYCETLQK